MVDCARLADVFKDLVSAKEENKMAAAQQMSFLAEVDEKEVRDIVIKQLRNYRALKVQMENKKEREQAGIVNLFPTLRKIDKENELIVRQIDRSLEHSLDSFERKIIEMKYLNSVETNDLNIYLELGLKKEKFYDKKRAAIFNLATALGIV
jgi:ArpU family phage transcriptional regulator